ncbi:MAG: Hint domain-containing protein [Paracoccaceae bacterium]
MLSNSVFPAARSRRSKVVSRRPKGPTDSAGTALQMVQGLGPMTRVTTAFGEVHAQTLRERDRVRTKNGEFLAVTSIDRITLDADFLKYHPGAQPILIRAGAFARGIPAADIVLAPFQRIDAKQPFIPNGLNKAIDAIHRPHVYRKSETMITYTIFHCEKPASVCCEGLWVNTSP